MPYLISPTDRTTRPDRGPAADAPMPARAGAIGHPAATVTVLIPTLNEARNLPWVLRRIPEFVDEVVIVDGHSSDRSVEVARAVRPDVVVVAEHRRGKGAAVRAGFAAATSDLIVMLDADGSMDPAEIGRYAALLSSQFDFVKGSRYLTGAASDDLTWLRDRGNRALTRLANSACHTRFSDLCYGYVGLRRECLPLLDMRSDGFEIETELVVRAARAGLRIAEVPSHEMDRLSGTTNLRTFRDGWRVLRTLATEWAGWEPVTAGAMPEAVRRVPYQQREDEGRRIPADPAALLAAMEVA